MLIAVKADGLADRLKQLDEHIARCQNAETEYRAQDENKPAWLFCPPSVALTMVTLLPIIV